MPWSFWCTQICVSVWHQSLIIPTICSRCHPNRHVRFPVTALALSNNAAASPVCRSLHQKRVIVGLLCSPCLRHLLLFNALCSGFISEEKHIYLEISKSFFYLLSPSSSSITLICKILVHLIKHPPRCADDASFLLSLLRKVLGFRLMITMFP